MAGPFLPQDPYLQQMIDSGLVDDRAQILAQQMKRGQSLMQTPGAQGQAVGGTFKAASPFEHLASAMARIIGGQQVRGAERGLEEGIQAKQAGRMAAMDSTLHPQPPPAPAPTAADASQPSQWAPPNLAGPLPSLPPGGGVLAPQAAPGAAPATPPQVPGMDRHGLATAMIASGDPSIAAMGQSILAQEQHAADRSMQEKHLGIQEKQMDNTLRHQQVLEGQGDTRLGLAQGHLDAINQRLALQGIRYNPNTGEFVNVRGRLAKPGSAPAPGAQPASATAPSAPGTGAAPAAGPGPLRAPPASGKILDKRLKELGSDFDPNGARAGEFGKNQARVNAANRVLALATDQNGNPVDLNPQQMPELSQSIASLISGGGVGTQAQIEHLTPHTMRGDLQKTLQWVIGNPRGADQVAFVQNMIDTAKRERTVAQTGIDAARQARGQKHQMVLRGNPNESRAVLRGYGWDLNDKGEVVPLTAQTSAPGAPGGGNNDPLGIR